MADFPQLEFLHINFILAIGIVEIELIIATAPSDPIVRLCAMPSPTLCYWFGIVFVGSAILTQMGKPLPFNMSSTPKGTPWRPALRVVDPIIEPPQYCAPTILGPPGPSSTWMRPRRSLAKRNRSSDRHVSRSPSTSAGGSS